MKTKPIQNSVIILIFDELDKMKVWNNKIGTLWHWNRNIKIGQLTVAMKFGSLNNKFKKVKINIPIEYANWFQFQFEN